MDAVAARQGGLPGTTQGTSGNTASQVLQRDARCRSIAMGDLDGDGEIMEYPFNLQVEATPIPFLEELARPDQPELRDPNPMVTQPDACN